MAKWGGGFSRGGGGGLVRLERLGAWLGGSGGGVGFGRVGWAVEGEGG